MQARAAAMLAPPQRSMQPCRAHLKEAVMSGLSERGGWSLASWNTISIIPAWVGRSVGRSVGKSVGKNGEQEDGEDRGQERGQERGQDWQARGRCWTPGGCEW